MHVQVNGRLLWFDVDGPSLVPHGGEMRERPTVVLLHGGPGGYDHSYFKPDFERLASVAQVVYLDVTGHGRSDLADVSSWTFELAADDVRAFCDVLGIERSIVYCHSLGAMIAAAYAARHPDHPRALVLQSGMGRYDLRRIVEGFRRFGGDDVAAIAECSYGDISPPVTMEEWERVRVVFGPHVLDEDERRRLVSVDLGESAFEQMRSFDVLAGLRSVTCSTLVCVGELDPVTPVAAAEELAAALGSARLEVIEGAGHWTWKDAPDTYWPLLTEFVSGA